MFEKTGVIQYVGVGAELLELQRRGEAVLRKYLPEEAEALIAARVARDGEGHAHVTLVNPRELNAMKKVGTAPDVTAWEIPAPVAKGVGVAVDPKDGHKAYFVVLAWPEGHTTRERLGLDRDGQHFHLTIGFDGKDVHGVAKNVVQWELV